MNYQARLNAVRGLMADQGLDLLLIGQWANREYLSGFRAYDESALSSAGWIVLGPDFGHFLTTFLYFEAVERQVSDLQPLRAPGRLPESLVALLNQAPGKTIGFEGDWINYTLYADLSSGLDPGKSLKPVDGLVEQLREIKDAQERTVIQEAIDLTDRAFEDVVAAIRPGQTEREVAWMIERRLRDLGADGMAFGPSVAAGPNSAIPHHEPSTYTLQAGEPIVIDLGARLNGYCADLTRSFCLHHASAAYEETWQLVLRAQEAGLSGLGAGITGRQADARSRDIFEAAGRGGEFGHSLGHGIGLMIHERPALSRANSGQLETGMIVTVEPGLYRPGWGGVRIEDVAAIEANGARVLSHAPKSAVIRPVGG